MTEQLIDVPPGLHGVVAADTAIGAVHGDEGYFHYGAYDAIELARTRTFEEVWWLIREGRLPSADELAQFRRSLAQQRRVPQGLKPLIEVVAAMDAPPLAKLRAVLSASSQVLNLAPVIDLDDDGRREQSLRLAAIVAPVVAALNRRGRGEPPVEPDPSLGHAASYLYETTGVVPTPVDARAVEQYLILTLDHGFNASTFTARVVASTGADVADAVSAALGALAKGLKEAGVHLGVLVQIPSSGGE